MRSRFSPPSRARWRPRAGGGRFPFTYHVGPGEAKVHLEVKSNWDQVTLYDVIARIPGSTFPDEWVVRGNHHDAWVNGAEDPVSGAVALLEEAHGLAELLKQGWKPKRTILYCVWDGEEQGLLGSTEWAEEHANELRQHAAVYINSDSNGRGYLYAGGSHSLEHLVNEVARDVDDPGDPPQRRQAQSAEGHRRRRIQRRQTGDPGSSRLQDRRARLGVATTRSSSTTSASPP